MEKYEFSEWKDIKNFTGGDNCLTSTCNMVLLKLSKLRKLKNKKRSEVTKIIKSTIARLGADEGHRVYANGLTNEDIYYIWGKAKKKDKKFNLNTYNPNKEWHYDLLWEDEDEKSHYLLKRVILVFESELSNKREGASDEEDMYGEMKYDFMKLLVSNADLRVVLFCEHKKPKSYKPDEKEAEEKELTDYFNLAVDTYEPTKQNTEQKPLFQILAIKYTADFSSFSYCYYPCQKK